MQALLSRIVAPAEYGAMSSPPSISIDPSKSSIIQSPQSNPLQTISTPATITVSPTVKAEILQAIERLQFATLLSERKKSIDALQSLAQNLIIRKHPDGRSNSDDDPTLEELEVGKSSIPAVLAALVSDPRDTELMEAMIEFLHYIVSHTPSLALLLLEQPEPPAPWGMQTSLNLLQDPSPWIRGPTIALIRALQDAQPHAFATSVLACKEGLRRLLEVVEDRREHIRDTALAVLIHLTGHDRNMQQFLAFEEGFMRLFQIIEGEGVVENGPSPVCADCLHIVNNMLRDNLMTQTLFLELPVLESHVPSILQVTGIITNDIDDESMALRKRVLKLGLELVRILVAGLYEGVTKVSFDALALRDRSRKQQELTKIQSLVARQEALMGAIGELVCCESDRLTDVRLEAIDFLRLVSQANGGVQMIVLNMYAVPSGRPVIAELMKLDVGKDRDYIPVAAAASSLLDALFEENEGACMAIVQHIQTPPPLSLSAEFDGTKNVLHTQIHNRSAGRVLLDALMVNLDFIHQFKDSADIEMLESNLVVAWKASHRLTKLLEKSSFCQELALRVPDEYDSIQARAVAGGRFLSRCIRLLRSLSSEKPNTAVQSILFQAKVALLILVIRWCHKCPNAVQEVVGSVTTLSVLVDALSDNPSSASKRNVSETTQLRGLVALLLGCCLEFLCDDTQAIQLANSPQEKALGNDKPELQMTRNQLLQVISTRVGIEPFTDALVQFQQTPSVITCAQASKTQSSRIVLDYRATYDMIDANVAGDDLTAENKAQYLFMLYERNFTVFYRDMAEQIQRRILALYSGVDSESVNASVVDSSALHAISAYQELIRMQDKQLQALKRQVNKLQQHSPTSMTKVVADDQSFQLMQDRADAECKIAKENELALAHTELEQEHERCEQACSRIDKSPITLPLSSDKLCALQAELEQESDLSRHLRREAGTSQREGITQVCQEQSDAEFAIARSKQQLEDFRVDKECKNEELAECNDMLEVLTDDQALIKAENVMLKAQLKEIRLKFGVDDDASLHSLINNLLEEKNHLSCYVHELEAAAHTTNDQEALHQRIPDVQQGLFLKSKALDNDIISDNADVSRDNEDCILLTDFVASQLEELEKLRALVIEMESVGKAREAKTLFLQNLVAEYNVKSRHAKEKYSESIRELEEELARAFLEKKDVGRKAKLAVKELENEVARLFLAQVELEKKVAQYQQEEQAGELMRKPLEPFEVDDDSTITDLLVLVASLEIQCTVLREKLKEVHGDDAVVMAAELSSQRGAVVLV